MIRLTCTQCKAVLDMDDAFAGGVCRCQYCGTIQTVPSHLKSNATSTAATPQPVASRALYNKTTVGAGNTPNSGIYELADAVGSGSTGSGLQRRPAATPIPPKKKSAPVADEPRAAMSNATKVMLISAGSVILALIVVMFWLIAVLMNKSTPAPPTPTVAQKPAPVAAPAVPTPVPSVLPTTPKKPALPAPKPVAVKPVVPVAPAPTSAAPSPAVAAAPRPMFLNVPLAGKRIMYVLDRGERTRPFVDPLKEAVFKSIETLGPDRDFNIIWWKKTGGMNASMSMPSYPKKGTARATAEQVAKCRAIFERSLGGGKTRVNEALEEALTRRPDTIIIVTGKGKTLESDFVTSVEAALGDRKIPVHTFAVGDNAGSADLKAIADKTGGTYMEITSASMTK